MEARVRGQRSRVEKYRGWTRFAVYLEGINLSNDLSIAFLHDDRPDWQFKCDEAIRL